MKVRLYFDDGTKSINEVDEETLEKQMKRPQSKRLYTYGIEFSSVFMAEVM